MTIVYRPMICHRRSLTFSLSIVLILLLQYLHHLSLYRKFDALQVLRKHIFGLFKLLYILSLVDNPFLITQQHKSNSHRKKKKKFLKSKISNVCLILFYSYHNQYKFKFSIYKHRSLITLTVAISNSLGQDSTDNLFSLDSRL